MTRHTSSLPVNFRQRLAVLFGGLFLTSIVLVAVFMDHVLSDRIIQGQGESINNLAVNIAKSIAANLQERRREVLLLAQSPTYVRDPLDSLDVRQSLERTKKTYKYYAWVGIADTSGKVISAAEGLLLGQSVAKRPWFIYGRRSPFIGDLHQAVLLAKLIPSSSQNEPLRFVDFASPIYDSSGHLRGVLATHARWEWVTDIIQERLPAKADLEIFIIDRRNNIISPFEAIGHVKASVRHDIGLPFFLGPWPGEGDYLYSEAQVIEPELGWRVIVRQPQKQALTALESPRNALMLLSLFASILLMGIVYCLATSFSRPLEQLAGIAERVGRGEEEADWEIKDGAYELQMLSIVIRNMALSLITRKQQLATINASLEHLVTERTNELRETNRLLVKQVRSDVLTGLYNRMAANERLQEEYLRHARTGVPYAALLLDVDHFKRVNDCYGHDVGDRVLRHIADQLKDSARATDFVARYGGEEFLILLPATDISGAAVLAEKIRAAIELSSVPDVGYITVCIGLAVVSSSDKQPEAAVKRADQALYRAKNNGRNRVDIHE